METRIERKIRKRKDGSEKETKIRLCILSMLVLVLCLITLALCSNIML